MKVVIQMTAREEVKALPILLRHSTGMVLPNQTYVISEAAAKALRDAGIRFTEVSRETSAPMVSTNAGENPSGPVPVEGGLQTIANRARILAFFRPPPCGGGRKKGTCAQETGRSSCQTSDHRHGAGGAKKMTQIEQVSLFKASKTSSG